MGGGVQVYMAWRSIALYRDRREYVTLPKKDAGRRTFKEEDALPHETSYIMQSVLAVEAPSYSRRTRWVCCGPLCALDRHAAPIRRTLHQSMSSGCSNGAWAWTWAWAS